MENQLPQTDNRESDMQTIESQIVSSSEAEEVNKDIPEKINQKPVVEEIIEQKKAYLLGEEKQVAKNHETAEAEDWSSTDAKIKESVDAKILEMDSLKITDDKEKIPQDRTQKVGVPKVPQDHTTPFSDK